MQLQREINLKKKKKEEREMTERKKSLNLLNSIRRNKRKCTRERDHYYI
jgi:hypothetical protein